MRVWKHGHQLEQLKQWIQIYYTKPTVSKCKECYSDLCEFFMLTVTLFTDYTHTHTAIYSLRRKNNDVNRTRRKNKKRDIQQTHTHTKNEDIVSPGFCHSKATNSSVACNPERKHTSEFQLKNEIQKKIKLEHSHNNAPLNGTVVFFSLHRNSTFFVFICFATAICKNCMFVLIAISCTARTHIHIHTNTRTRTYNLESSFDKDLT